MVAAVKQGRTTQFSDRVWESGQPQRYGWVPLEMVEEKVIPKEIIDFAEMRAAKKQDLMKAFKTEENDNTEQKKPRKKTRKPRAVGNTSESGVQPVVEHTRKRRSPRKKNTTKGTD